MTISIIAVSGSLRFKSTNTRLLQEIESVLDVDISFSLYDGVEELPQFNPDKESLMNSHTRHWVRLMREADALIVSSPEYAHGIPGALKNALDWLVGTDAFIAKPFCQYRACPRPEFAPPALLEVIKTMSGIHIDESDITIDLRRNYALADSILAEKESRAKISNSLKYLCDFILDARNN